MHFSPRVRDWFAGRFPAPTDVQERAWPVIASGAHVLLTAPTGSGKTLTAFLWAIDRLVSGAWQRGGVRVLYVSPLKALNNDIRNNLLDPIEELRSDVTVGVRSGDTPQSERQRMVRRPPDILVTTPESLNLLLSSPRARGILAGVRTVILDEIHAVAGTKRGSYLMTAVERLVPLCGEFQRIALSATVRPLETVAAFVAGFDAAGDPRPVRIVASAAEKRLELAVRALPRAGEKSVWPALVAEFRALLEQGRSTLFFVNNRAASEKIVRWMNEGEEAPLAYAHHGSLSREIRELVERKLKAGELKALVATSSLEMGIDIGALDRVVLVETPRSLHSAVQRVGRAGHAVGATSRGVLFPTHARDFLDAAVVAPLVEAREVEPLRCIRNPLDVLAQVLLSMCGVEELELDAAYALLRRSWPYHALPRATFDRVVAMLRGRYADTRIRELRPRLRLDPETGRARSRDGVLPLLYRSGGVIPDRGYFAVRLESGARVGELDEEFVWERRLGDQFTIGAQRWRIERITKSDVIVTPGAATPSIAPFWRAERQARDWEFCERIGLFLEDYVEEHTPLDHLDAESRARLRDLLRRQREATGVLPHRHRMVAEQVHDGQRARLVLHACWGGRVLRPWGIALSAAWQARTGVALDVENDDDCLLVQLPEALPTSELLDLVRPDNVEELVRARLGRTGLFGARFRENAARALLLPRQRAGARMPLWLNRQRAKKLLQAVERYPDFPLLAETWRECLEDEFDLKRLAALLDELQAGAIDLHEVVTSTASPLAAGVVWRGTDSAMYADDRPEEGAPAGPGEAALREVLHDAALRPRLDPVLVRELEGKLQRTAPGYEPTDDADWIDCVEERLLVPPWDETLPPGLERVAWGRGWVVSTVQRARLERARGGDGAALAGCLGEYLRTHGPVTAKTLAECWEVDPRPALERLVRDGSVVADRFLEGATETEYCDVENLERLLRLTRARRRADFRARPIGELALFLARYQGVARPRDGIEALRAALETLFGYAAPAALWESAILPARVADYAPHQLDTLLLESDLSWFGAGREQLAFCFRDERPLFQERESGASALLPERSGRYDFFELEKATGLASAELTERLWEETWAGRVANDGFAAVRSGLAARFRPEKASRGRRAFSAWHSSRPLSGSWHALPSRAAPDALAAAEEDRARARQLLARYGVLFRELCAAEGPRLRWGRLLKALRLLELSGEVLAGRFFDGGDGLQFATHDAFRALRRAPDEDAVFWINAADPASLCGLGLLGDLPSRLPASWLVYHGSRLVLVARRGGRQVELRAPPDARYLEFFRTRPGALVEEIDGVPAASSPHAALFREFGFWVDRSRLVLEKRYS